MNELISYSVYYVESEWLQPLAMDFVYFILLFPTKCQCKSECFKHTSVILTADNKAYFIGLFIRKYPKK